MRDVRYGIIGTGSMGLEHIADINALEGGQVVALCDPAETSLQTAALVAPPGAKTFSDHRSMLEWGEIDAAVVVTPNHTHHGILLDLIDADIHFLTEKPLCINFEQCAEVVAASARSDKIHWMGLEYRFVPPIARLIAELDEARHGRVRMVAIREHRIPFLQKVGNWNRFRKNTGGTLVEKCCHFFDLMNLLAGARPGRVMASGAQDVNHLDEEYDGAATDIIDNAYVIVEYENGVRAALDLSMFGEGGKWEQEIVVTGAQGKLEAFVPAWYDGGLGVVRFSTRQGGIYLEREVDDERIAAHGHHHGASYLEHLRFRSAIVTAGAPEVTLEDGMWSVVVAEAAHRAIDERRIIDIAELIGADR